MATTHLLYLHGFRSSPLSTKARLMAGWMREHRSDVHWWCPQLPASPQHAMALVMQGIAQWPHAQMAVVGSSLGGFYATVVAQATGCRAALLNPAVQPARDLARHIGTHAIYHEPQAQLEFRAEYVAELRAMHPGCLSKLQRYCAIIAKGDEVLSWQEMHARYAGANIRLLEGSDHALSDFDTHLPFILKHLFPCD